MSHQPNPFDGIPARFDYIRDVVLRYARQGRNHDPAEWRQSLAALSPAQLREIAEVYDRMAAGDDTPALLAWIHAVSPGIRRVWREWQDRYEEAERLGLPEPAEPPLVPRAHRLFDLFEELAALGREPFTSRRVQYEPPAPDWTHLPERLRYLIEPATRWGTYQFDEQIDELERTIRPEDRTALRALARRLRDSGDWAPALDWTSSLSWTDHREAALMHWLLSVLMTMVPEMAPK